MTKRWKRRVSVVFGLMAFALIGISSNPVPAAKPENCETVTGRVVGVDSPCCRDVVLKLENDPRVYYINRGLDREIDLERLRANLSDTPVTLQVIRRTWSPLDPTHQMAPVAQVIAGDKVVFSALQ